MYKKRFLFNLFVFSFIAFLVLVAINLVSGNIYESDVFSFPTGQITRSINPGQKLTFVPGDNLIVNIDGSKKTMKLESLKSGNAVVSLDGVKYKLTKGSSREFKVLGEKSFKLNVLSISNNRVTLSVEHVKERPALRGAVSQKSAVLAKPIAKVQPKGVFSRLLQKFGFGGGGKDLPKEPKVPPKPSAGVQVDYPIYNLDVQNKVVTSKEEDLLLNVLKKRGQVFLLTTTDYGLFIILGLCNNNKFNPEIGETDLDCGGPCQSCDDYKVCREFSDCKSNKCQQKASGARREYNGVCIPSSVPVCVETDTGVEVKDLGSVPNKCVDFDSYVKVSCIGPDIKTYIESDPIDCPPNTFCQNGACVPNERYCNDNDAANDRNVIGIAFDPQNTNRQLGKDYCETSVNLQQVNCKGAGVDYSPGVCADDEVCKDGACFDACDENDPENNNYLLGIAKDGSDVELGKDSCATDRRLKQVNCVGRNVEYSENDCLPNELCKDGVCFSPCLEDDEADDPYYLGTATDQVGRELGKDFCVNDWELKQVKCVSGNAEYSDPKTCENNEICSGGVCISRDVCKEPDPDDPVNEGETVFPAVAGGEIRRHIDSCIVEGGKKVKHVVCRDDTPSVSITECPDPTVCNKGLCGSQPVTHCTDYDWGAIDKRGVTKWNQCDYDFPTTRLLANCFVDGSVQYFPEACLDGGICMWPGVCVKNKCEDSDGIDPNTVGRVEESRTIVESGAQQDNVYFDECRIYVDYYDNEIDLTKNYIWEHGCTSEIEDLNGEPSRKEYSQNIACSEGYHCENSFDVNGAWLGASCVEGEKTYECHDSDGEDPSSAGVVTTDRAPGNEWRDGCYSDSHGVREYVCKTNGYVSEKYVECEKYCDWGKCSKGIDTDPNSDPEKAGVVTDVNGAIHPDICKNEDVVLEYSYKPETGEATETEVPCPENTKCENDACVRVPDSEIIGTCCSKENNQQAFDKPISREDCFSLGYEQNVGVYFIESTSDDACSKIKQEFTEEAKPVPAPEPSSPIPQPSG